MQKKILNKIVFPIFLFLSILFLIEGCSSSYRTLTKEEEETVSAFANRLSSDVSDIDTLQRKIIYEGLRSIGEYLLEKDAGSFKKLEQEVTCLEGSALLASKIYDIDFLKMATDFYRWSDERASQKFDIRQDSTMQFVLHSTPHFLIYYFPELPENDLHYIAYEAERVYDTLLTLFKPDSLGLSNFQRLAIYESWKEGKFDKQSDSLLLSDSRIVLLITGTQEQLHSFIKNPDPATGGRTNFSFVSSLPDSVPVWITCQIALNYSSPLSLVPLTHEITHAITWIIYSRPWLIDSALTKSNKNISSLSLEQFYPAVIRLNVLVVEGIAYWSNWSIGIFEDVHFLPKASEIIRESKIELPTLATLITGEINFSFWDIVRGVFGYVPRDKITQFFISSASFMEFLIPSSTPDQLQKLFTGSSEELTAKDLELIYEKPISQLEAEWRDYVLQTEQLSSQ